MQSTTSTFSNLCKIVPAFADYIECALWASVYMGPEERSEDDPETFDEFSATDIADDTLWQMAQDWNDFQRNQSPLLEEAETEFGYTIRQAAHDFWLTRNGHGAGFWDRGIGEIGEKLSSAARVYGSQDLWADEDGQIHLN